MTSKAVYLFSSISTDQIQAVNSRRLEDVLLGKQIEFLVVDGADPSVKELRDKLFAVSTIRGKYPQCFIEESDGNFKFVGLWEDIESLLDCDQLPAEVLEANPQINTFSKVFAEVSKRG
eukprot:gene12135-16246_t